VKIGDAGFCCFYIRSYSDVIVDLSLQVRLNGTFYRGCNTVQIVCPSEYPFVALVDYDHIGWKFWELISRLNSLRFLLKLAPKAAILYKGNTPKNRVE